MYYILVHRLGPTRRTHIEMISRQRGGGDVTPPIPKHFDTLIILIEKKKGMRCNTMGTYVRINNHEIW